MKPNLIAIVSALAGVLAFGATVATGIAGYGALNARVDALEKALETNEKLDSIKRLLYRIRREQRRNRGQ